MERNTETSGIMHGIRRKNQGFGRETERGQQSHTVLLISTARFSVHILLIRHHKSDLAHISDRYSSVIELYLSEIRAKNN